MAVSEEGCQEGELGTSLVVQWLRLHAPDAGAPGSIPEQGTRSYWWLIFIQSWLINMIRHCFFCFSIKISKGKRRGIIAGKRWVAGRVMKRVLAQSQYKTTVSLVKIKHWKPDYLNEEGLQRRYVRWGRRAGWAALILSTSCFSPQFLLPSPWWAPENSCFHFHSIPEEPAHLFLA